MLTVFILSTKPAGNRPAGFLFGPKMDEDQLEEETTKAIHRLSDMEIATVGLVTQGANRATFHLLKSQEGHLMNEDELEIVEEVEETPEIEETPTEPEVAPDSPAEVEETDESFLAKMYHALGSIFKARKPVSKDQLAQAAKILGITQKELSGMMYPPDEDEMEMGRTGSSRPNKKKTSPKATAKSAVTPVVQEIPMDQTELVKSAAAEMKTEMESLIKGVRADLEKQYQDKITALESQVETLSKSEAEQRDKREEREYLEKAMQFRAFPVQYTELGQMLRNLSKSVEAAEFEKWEAVLKAADRQLFASGLFNEMGTARTAEEVTLVEKVEKKVKEENMSFEDALLSLSPAEQEQLLAEQRARAGGK